MRNMFRLIALGSTALIGTAVWAQTAPPSQLMAPSAQAPAPFDLSQLPATKGKVQQYTTNRHGDIDGIILTDGTEVKVPPHLTVELVAAIKVGDSITVRGLKAASIPLVAASSVTNDASGVAVVDNGPTGKKGGKHKGGPGDAAAGTPTDFQGRIKASLHGRKGEINGALLDDGMVLRLPPPEATRLAAMLAPGQTVAVRGMLTTTPYGKSIEVRGLGASLDKLSDVQAPPPGTKGPKGPKGSKV